MKKQISMIELVTLKAACEAISSEGLFGFDADMKIQSLGSRARKAVEYVIGADLDRVRGKRIEIEASYQEKLAAPSLSPDALKKLNESVAADEEYQALVKEDRELWDKKMDDFEFEPVAVKISEDISDRIKSREQMKSWRGIEVGINVYTSILRLLSEDEGYLIRA